MAKYSFIAIDLQGKQTKGTLDATSQQDANAQLNAKGFMPIKVALSDDESGKASSRLSINALKGIRLGRVVKPENLCTCTRQLATLVQAGLPLLNALEVMIRQEKNLRFKEVLEKNLRPGTLGEYVFRRIDAASKSL